VTEPATENAMGVAAAAAPPASETEAGETAETPAETGAAAEKEG